MSRKEVETFAAAILSADGFDARRAAIALVVCAQSLVHDDPINRRILADTLRATAAELDDYQRAMN
jgi:hypothetical protein